MMVRNGVLSLVAMVHLIIVIAVADAQLSPTFYERTCSEALPTIKASVESALSKEARMGASLLRLHFHDCFVNGCDASVLLDDTPSFQGEKTAPPNNNSIRGFDVIDSIKTQLELICPGIVSCADILTVAARDSVVKLGGTSWTVMLGRRDSITANWTTASSDIPSPFLNLEALIAAFSTKGFTPEEMVALSGSHTIGKARCSLFTTQLYNETDTIDPSFAASLKASCPASGGDSLSALDTNTSALFDNAYFNNLQARKGLLHSDQQLFITGSSIKARVAMYSSNQSAFLTDFAAAMVKMGNLSPLTGTAGQIRKNCRVIN